MESPPRRSQNRLHPSRRPRARNTRRPASRRPADSGRTAGSTEAFILFAGGEIGITKTVLGFLLPALIGNVVGGTTLFALLAYGQVKEELHPGA